MAHIGFENLSPAASPRPVSIINLIEGLCMLWHLKVLSMSSAKTDSTSHHFFQEKKHPGKSIFSATQKPFSSKQLLLMGQRDNITKGPSKLSTAQWKKWPNFSESKLWKQIYHEITLKRQIWQNEAKMDQTGITIGTKLEQNGTRSAKKLGENEYKM